MLKLNKQQFITILIIFLIPAISNCGIWDIFESTPELNEEQTQWRLFKHDPPLSWENSPYEVFEDGFKMIRVFKVEEEKLKTHTIPAHYMVEWGWKMKVKNKSKENHEVKIEYKLLDKDGFVVSEIPFFSEYIAAGETKTFQKTFTISYKQLPRVEGRSWSINCTASCFLLHKN